MFYLWKSEAIKADCRSRDRKNHGGHHERGGPDLVLSDDDFGRKIKSPKPKEKSTDLMPDANNEQDE